VGHGLDQYPALHCEQDLNPLISPRRTLENPAWNISRICLPHQIEIDVVWMYHLKRLGKYQQRDTVMTYSLQTTKLTWILPCPAQSPITHCQAMFQANPSEWSSRGCTVTTGAPGCWQLLNPKLLRRQALLTPAIPALGCLSDGSHMPLSILYVDLQISSSSEKNDLEWYTSWKGRLTSSVSVFEGMAGLNRGGQRGQALSA
jgi:hypothetical protein